MKIPLHLQIKWKYKAFWRRHSIRSLLGSLFFGQRYDGPIDHPLRYRFAKFPSSNGRPSVYFFRYFGVVLRASRDSWYLPLPIQDCPIIQWKSDDWRYPNFEAGFGRLHWKRHARIFEIREMEQRRLSRMIAEGHGS